MKCPDCISAMAKDESELCRQILLVSSCSIYKLGSELPQFRHICHYMYTCV